MKLIWCQPVKPTHAARRWWFPSMRRDWHGIPVQRMKLSSTSPPSDPHSPLHHLRPFPQDWIFSSGLPSSFSYLSYFWRCFNPCIVWQSRRAMLLYILAELIVREQVTVLWCIMKSSGILLWLMWWQKLYTLIEPTTTHVHPVRFCKF